MNQLRAFLTGDDCEIAFQIEGPTNKPVLMLSNSIATTMQMWKELIPLLRSHFRILRYDARGHGASGVPAGGYGLDRLGRDALELMDHLQLNDVHFCGLSLGGFVGQWLGIHAPHRLASLILANTSSYLGPAPQWDSKIRGVLAAKTIQETATGFINNWFSSGTRQTQATRVEEFYHDLLTLSTQGIAANLAAVRDTDMRRTVSLIELPTLIIAGRHDPVTLASHSELMASTISNARLMTFEAVHMTPVEQPEAFAKALVDFINNG
ncbi:alpha/beta fold hydrolase [Bowmanella denitrificans]|uniref:alpha/beta fold hydrolase n=1 Tax=Bowmanella denitrificans TaxID=366582 RepID=UPI000C9C28C8|nr:alpha/beta fold hydrolase [Bowmanella denitrificans]